MKSLKSLEISFAMPLLLLIFVLSSTLSFAGPMSETTQKKLKGQIEELGLSDLHLDFNIQIPITGNPAGSDTNLWATAIYHKNAVDNTGSAKRPTILVATAYRREMMLPVYLLSFLMKDYNVLSVDMRGTGSSEGVWGAMNPTEQFDIVHIVDEWIPSQSWSDGKVGMVGGSYMAIVQYQVSALVEQEYNPATGKVEPKHLKALAALSSMSDAYREIAMHGGNFEMEFMAVWIGLTDILSVLPPDLYLGGHSSPGMNMDDVRYATEIWKEHFSNLNVPINWILDPANMLKNSWYEDKSPFIYWPQKPEGGWNFGPDYPYSTGRSEIPKTIPIFNTGGWFDIFTRGTLNNYQYGLANHNASDKALVVGPWYHIDAAALCPGLNGIGLGGEGLLNNDLLIRWFDWKIKGKNDPFMEEFPVALYIMGEEKWRMEKAWPLPESRLDKKTYYLSKAKPSAISGDWFSTLNQINNFKLVEQAGTSDYYTKFLWFKFAKKNPVLRHDPPFFHGISSRSAQRWLGFSPLSLVSQLSKYTFKHDIDHLMPWEDERLDELGVLTFTTEPLSKDTEISGPLKLTFWAETKFNRPLAQSLVDDSVDVIMEHFDIGENENAVIEMADKKDVQWVIEVNDVFPNGRARNITSGWLSSWHRPYDPENPTQMDPEYIAFDPFYDYPNKNPDPVSEGTLYPYVIEIWPTDNVFKKGHRVRVSISASDIPHLFPVLRPSENTIVIDPSHKAKIEFHTVNNEQQGTTWKWVDDISEYLMTHKN